MFRVGDFLGGNPAVDHHGFLLGIELDDLVLFDVGRVDDAFVGLVANVDAAVVGGGKRDDFSAADDLHGAGRDGRVVVVATAPGQDSQPH